jgi:hypothetical protein
MNLTGKAIGAELESQNKFIDRLGTKVDTADDRIWANSQALKRIERS